jgi:hypothetical protein
LEKLSNVGSTKERTRQPPPKFGNDCKQKWKQLGQHFQAMGNMPAPAPAIAITAPAQVCQAQKPLYYNFSIFSILFTRFALSTKEQMSGSC